MNVGGGVPVDMPSGIGVGAAPADCAETASARAPLSPAILARGLAALLLRMNLTARRGCSQLAAYVTPVERATDNGAAEA